MAESEIVMKYIYERIGGDVRKEIGTLDEGAWFSFEQPVSGKAASPCILLVKRKEEVDYCHINGAHLGIVEPEEKVYPIEPKGGTIIFTFKE